MATQAAAAKTHGVAIKLASATKITNAAIWYYCAALLLVLLSLIRRQSGLWCEWRVFSSLAGLDSVFKNALQYAKQLFSVRIPVMTKYCIMRECDNIRNGYLYGGDLLFVILKGIYGLNSPKGFWRSLPEISLLHFFFSSSANLKTWLPNLGALFARLNALQPAVKHSHNFTPKSSTTNVRLMGLHSCFQ